MESIEKAIQYLNKQLFNTSDYETNQAIIRAILELEKIKK